MPAPVPAGHTRGAIVVIGASHTPDHQAQLIQRFWNEAGGYGARIVICATPQMQEKSHTYQVQLQQLETATITELVISDRQLASQSEQWRAIDVATGILLLAPTPNHVAALLGGTPLATAIRRANASGKTIAGESSSAAVLCQHVIIPKTNHPPTNPLLQPDRFHFTPGLGLVNRLLLTIETEPQSFTNHLPALLTAIAHNPFLVGVDIEPDTGLVIYPDTTLEVFGANNILIVDGNHVSHTDRIDTNQPTSLNLPLSLHGVQLHVLKHGQTFNFDSHQAKAQPVSDLPAGEVPYPHSF